MTRQTQESWYAIFMMIVGIMIGYVVGHSVPVHPPSPDCPETAHSNVVIDGTRYYQEDCLYNLQAAEAEDDE